MARNAGVDAMMLAYIRQLREGQAKQQPKNYTKKRRTKRKRQRKARRRNR